MKKLKATPILSTIDFDLFRVKNVNYRKAFESLSYYLFCRKFGITDGVFRYQNQTGIETMPIKSGKQVFGFQAKFFDNTLKYDEVFKSIAKAKAKHKNLSDVIVYTNQEHSESSDKTILISKEHQKFNVDVKEIKIKVEWVVPSNFEILLNQPCHLDLAQLFFGISHEYSFIQNNINPQIQTLLSSKEYIQIPLKIKDTVIPDPVKSIKTSRTKSFLIIGHPGSGKSIYMHYLYQQLSGLDAASPEIMIREILKNSAIPMLINLKDCINESLENIIRNRQIDKNIQGHTLGFTYIFDGLDELSDENAELVLSHIRLLEMSDKTKKIIISCRTGNMNRIKVPVYLEKVTEMTFSDLNDVLIKQYFESKGDIKKLSQFRHLSRINPALIADVKDVLLVKLLWETINDLNKESTISDLVEKKITYLLCDLSHKKNIDSLNLLDKKSNIILKINQELSFEFHKKFQFRFSQQELQETLLSLYPRLNYKDINDIINYLGNAFFESNYDNSNGGLSYIYQHRRYQEYFFTQKLIQEYQKAPSILRELDVLTNRDYFENFFLAYLRKDYEKRGDIVGATELNLLDVYLGKHDGFGVEDSYYLNSFEFVPALVSQPAEFINELFESENFNLKKVFFIDTVKLKAYFNKWKPDDLLNHEVNQYISNIYDEGIANLIQNIVIFWEANHKEFANKLLKNFEEVETIFRKHQYEKLVNDAYRRTSPYWKTWESYLYILLVIDKTNPMDVFLKQVRQHYRRTPDFDVREHNTRLYRSYFEILLKHFPAILNKQINDYEGHELVYLLSVFSAIEYVSYFTKNKQLQKSVANAVAELNLEFKDANTTGIAFVKRYFELPFTESELSLLKQHKETIASQRKVDIWMKHINNEYAVICYALNKNRLEAISPDDTFHYDKNDLYILSGLYIAYIEMLKNGSSIFSVLRAFTEYRRVEVYDERYFGYEISTLWAYLFANSQNENRELIIGKQILLNDELDIDGYTFLSILMTVNKRLYCKLINESDINRLVINKLDKPDDFQTIVNRSFNLSLFYSMVNEEKAKLHFLQGIKNGMLRHGWRKDPLVSFNLVEALDILWRNNWETEEHLKEYTKEVFVLTLKVSEFTDGKGTWSGPYNVVDTIAAYNLELAEELMDKLIESKGKQNYDQRLITTILLAKIKRGYPIPEIEEGIKQYKRRIDYEGKPYAEYFEAQLQVYSSIMMSDLYTEQEKATVFENAYNIAGQFKKNGIKYYLQDPSGKDVAKMYLDLCRKYRKEPNIELVEEELSVTKLQSESTFYDKIQKANSKLEINKLFKQLTTWSEHIVISNQETWKLLLEKLYKFNGNIDLFIKYLLKSHFPHADYFHENSRYLHLALGAALNNMNMRPAIIKYLFNNTGHGGFIHLMESYESIGDKQTCRKLFLRYLQICHLLCD